jgi:hypothetical protein
MSRRVDGDGVAVDKAGRSSWSGWRPGAGETQDGLIIALSPGGYELWRRTFDGPARAQG